MHYPNGNFWKAREIRVSYVAFRCRRIFNNGSWSDGGRHYNAIQNCSQIERATILFNGNPTIELDFKAMHPTMLYHKGHQAPPKDCYSVFGDLEKDKLARECVKLLLLSMINASSETDALGAVQYKYNLQKHKLNGQTNLPFIIESCGFKKLAEIAKIIQRFHAPIAHFFHSGIGIKLQKDESEIMRAILHHCVKKFQIPAIPVHDSVIVPSTHAELVTDLMMASYEKRMGDGCQIIVEAKG